MLFGDLFEMGLTEQLRAFSAVGTLIVGHILNDANNGDVHEGRHVDSLLHYHRNEILRSGYDNDAVDGQGLEHGQRHISGSRRHINKHIVDIVPDHIGPELLYGACYDRTTPDNGIGIVFKQEIDAHKLDPGV